MNELKITKKGRKELRLLAFELSAELRTISNELIEKVLLAESDSSLYETVFELLDVYLPSMKHSYLKDFEQIDDQHVFFESAS